jgi:hypothetical protein
VRFWCAVVVLHHAVRGEGPEAGGRGNKGPAQVLAHHEQPEGGAVPERAGGDPGAHAGSRVLQGHGPPLPTAGAVPK